MDLELLEDYSSLSEGQLICKGRYEVISLLGVGGFAAVYKIRDIKLGGILAMKILDPIRSGRKAFTERFYQEIRLTRQLQHHNTIKIYDAGTTEEGCLYMTMELVDGEPLDEVLTRERALAPERALRIALQVLKSLSEAHEHGIVHRDLKPSNIMLCQQAGEKDYVKVVDFGIAKALDPGMGTMKTETGVFLCTPSYAAPEQLLGLPIGPSSDIYSLALIIIEMMTGHIVMDGSSLGEIIKKQCDTLPVPIPTKVGLTPLGAILKRATNKEAADRYAVASEMLDDLVGVDVKSLRFTVEGLIDVGLARANSLKATIDSGVHRNTTVEPDVAAGKLTRFQKRSIQVSAVLGVLSLLTILTFSFVYDGEPIPNDPIPAGWGGTDNTQALGSDLTTDETALAEANATASSGEGEEPDKAEGTGSGADTVAVAGAEPKDPGSDEVLADADATETVHLVVTSSPPGATVYLEGDPVGETPLEQELESWEGPRRITVRRRGYRTWRDDLEIDGPVLLVDARLRERPSADQTQQDDEDFDPFGQIEAR